MVRTPHLAYRHKIVVQQVTESTDSAGEPIKTWSDYIERKARIVPMGGREAFRYQQHFSERTSIFKTRFDSKTIQIDTKMRIVFNSRNFDIKSVINENEINREITIICDEDGI